MLLLFTGLLFPQGKEDLAKKSQNPISNMISLPLQNNTSFNIGPFNRTQNVLNIQPVWPFSLSPSLNLITRTIVPVISQPIGESDSKFGLGDINFTAFFSPADPGKVIWGLGPTFFIPTASDAVLGSEKWSAGPGLVVLTMPGSWVIGLLANNVWSFAGKEERADVNKMLIQYFINYNISDGWYLSSAPIITANWKAESGQQWVIPFGGGFGKIFKIGSQPLNAQVQAFANVVKPDNGADWSMRLQLQFLFPK
ncbi:MAG: neuromedin U [Ignavibacteria bacterium]|nr:neuromedin U [Ignavibacteria bacterium]